MRRSASDLNAASLVDLSEFRFAVLVRMPPAAGSLNSRITPSIEMISPLFVRWDAVVLRVIVLDKDCLVKVLDYIWLSPEWRVNSVQQLMKITDLKGIDSFPSNVEPSDHVLLAADLVFDEQLRSAL